MAGSQQWLKNTNTVLADIQSENIVVTFAINPVTSVSFSEASSRRVT
jgi:hypothetical protein